MYEEARQERLGCELQTHRTVSVEASCLISEAAQALIGMVCGGGCGSGSVPMLQVMPSQNTTV